MTRFHFSSISGPVGGVATPAGPNQTSSDFSSPIATGGKTILNPVPAAPETAILTIKSHDLAYTRRGQNFGIADPASQADHARPRSGAGNAQNAAHEVCAECPHGRLGEMLLGETRMYRRSWYSSSCACYRVPGHASRRD